MYVAANNGITISSIKHNDVDFEHMTFVLSKQRLVVLKDIKTMILKT